MEGIDLGGRETALEEALRRLDGLGVSLDEKAKIMSKLGLEPETTPDVVQGAER